jgi:hypothetical protein
MDTQREALDEMWDIRNQYRVTLSLLERATRDILELDLD